MTKWMFEFLILHTLNTMGHILQVTFFNSTILISSFLKSFKILQMFSLFILHHSIRNCNFLSNLSYLATTPLQFLSMCNSNFCNSNFEILPYASFSFVIISFIILSFVIMTVVIITFCNYFNSILPFVILNFVILNFVIQTLRFWLKHVLVLLE